MKQQKRNVFEVHGNTVIYFLYDKHSGRTFRGVAQCQPEDVFDLETGKKIAKLKAILKMQMSYDRMYDQMFEVCQAWKESEEYIKDQAKYWQNKVENTFKRLVEITGLPEEEVAHE